VQGPLSPVATAYLIRERPSVLYLSGPPAYLESQIGRDIVEKGIDNLLRIVQATGCRVILDHHALRAQDYRERLGRLWEGGRVLTAAGFLGLADAALEARRHELWAARRKAPAPMPMWPGRLKSRRPSAMMKARSEPKPAKEGTTE